MVQFLKTTGKAETGLIIAGMFNLKLNVDRRPYGGFHCHGGTPKRMVYKGNPIKMDDWGVPQFMETPISLGFGCEHIPED